MQSYTVSLIPSIVGAIAASIGTIFLLVSAGCRWKQKHGLRKKPFTVKYVCREGKNDVPAEASIRAGKIIPWEYKWVESDIGLELKQHTEYTLFIQLTPREAWNIQGIDFRFQPVDDENVPIATKLADINPQAFYNSISIQQTKTGRRLWYSPALPCDERKTVEYFTILATSGTWQGKLCVFPYIGVGIDKDGITISCTVKS